MKVISKKEVESRLNLLYNWLCTNDEEHYLYLMIKAEFKHYDELYFQQDTKDDTTLFPSPPTEYYSMIKSKQI